MIVIFYFLIQGCPNFSRHGLHFLFASLGEPQLATFVRKFRLEL